MSRNIETIITAWQDGGTYSDNTFFDRYWSFNVSNINTIISNNTSKYFSQRGTLTKAVIGATWYSEKNFGTHSAWVGWAKTDDGKWLEVVNSLPNASAVTQGATVPNLSTYFNTSSGQIIYNAEALYFNFLFTALSGGTGKICRLSNPYITFTIQRPLYTIVFKNYDGTVLQTAEYYYGDNVSYNNATPVRAEDAQYTYTFAGWDKTISSASGDTVYTAKFTSHLKPVYISYDSIFSFKQWTNTNLTSWDLITISDITDTSFTGTAKVDDAYTLECRPLIPVEVGKTYTFECVTSNANFEIFVFNCDSSGAWSDFTYGGSNQKFNFTPSKNYISIRCDVIGAGTVVNFSNFRIYPADCPYMSSSVLATERTDISSWSMPTPIREGFSFKGWNTKPDGSGITYASNSAFPTTNLVLYSQWEKKFNNIYIGTSQPLGIYVGTQAAQQIYLGTTKFYEQGG